PLQQQPPPPQGAAAPLRARRNLESDGVLVGAGHDGAHVTRGLGLPAPRRARQGEPDAYEAKRRQVEDRAPGGGVTPRIARAAAVVSVWGASASTSPDGSGFGLSALRSTHTSTIHPVATSRGGSSRSTSKFRVMDLVPTRPTYVATRSRSSSRAGT